MRRRHELLFEEFATDVTRRSEADYIEVPVSTRTFLLVSIGVVVVLLGLLSRMAYLNLSQKSFYSARATSNVDVERPITAQRGTITDRYGEILAKNTETFSVFADAAALFKDRRQMSETLNQLSVALDLPIETLEEALSGADYEVSADIPLVRNITPEAAIAVRGLNLQAVSVVNDLRREYIDGPIFAPIIGYTGAQADKAEIVGKAGLERAYDSALRGVDGAFVVSRDARGHVLEERLNKNAQSGQSITTTIDAGLQRYFYERLSGGLRSLGVFGGVGLAMDPKTGEILSLVSLPSYDNNVFVTPGMNAERVKLVTDGVRKPLFDRAVSGAYNPGSTIKPLVALAGLHEKVITPDDVVFSKGYIEIPNPYVPDKPSRFVEFN
jgi:penicillin-binding protein 2